MINKPTDLIIYSNMIDFYLKNPDSFPRKNYLGNQSISFWLFPDDLKRKTGRKIKKIIDGLIKKNINIFIYPLPLCLYGSYYPKSIRKYIIPETTSLPPAFLNEYGIKHVHTKEDIKYIRNNKEIFKKCFSCHLKKQEKCRGIYTLFGSSVCEEKLKHWLIDKTKSLVGGNLLDCGCGINPSLLDFYREISLKNNKIYFLDPSGESLASLKQRVHYFSGNIFLVKGMAEKMNFKNNFFDVILLISTYSHLRNLKMALGNIRKSLKKEGLLLISDSIDHIRMKHNEEEEFSLWNNHFRNHTFNQTTSTIKKCGFKIIDVFTEKTKQASYWIIKTEKYFK